MNAKMKLSDYDHPVVQAKARELIKPGASREENLKSIFQYLPDAGGHAWIEVEVNGDWKSIDSYINDAPLYYSALKLLLSSGKKTGYSLSLEKGGTSCEFNFGELGFVHMGAVVKDHGIWDDFSDYMVSDKYLALNGLKLKIFQSFTRTGNRNITKIRLHY